MILYEKNQALQWMAPLKLHRVFIKPQTGIEKKPLRKGHIANSAFWLPKNPWNSNRCGREICCSRKTWTKVTCRHQAQPNTSEKSKELFSWATEKNSYFPWCWLIIIPTKLSSIIPYKATKQPGALFSLLSWGCSLLSWGWDEHLSNLYVIIWSDHQKYDIL